MAGKLREGGSFILITATTRTSTPLRPVSIIRKAVEELFRIWPSIWPSIYGLPEAESFMLGKASLRRETSKS